MRQCKSGEIQGKFHKWGQRGQIADGEGFIDPVAIVEDGDGQVHVVDADTVWFLEAEEQEKRGAVVTEAMKRAAIGAAIRGGRQHIAAVIEAALNAREC